MAVSPSGAVESDHGRQRVGKRGAAAQKRRLTQAPYVAWNVTEMGKLENFGRSLA